MAQKNRQAGYTLVELLVALTLGLLVVASLTIVYVNSSLARTELEKASRQNENGSYAIEMVSNELRNAGYLAEFNPKMLPLPIAKQDPCATDLPTLKAALPIAVQGYDNGATLTCITDVMPNTDILVVRRTSTCAVGDAGCDSAVANAPYFHASGCNSVAELSSGVVSKYYAFDTDMTKLTLLRKECALVPPVLTPAPRYQYRVHIYFVAKNDKGSDGIPTLKRAELGVVGTTLAFTVVPLVEGIENLQIEYGLDTSTPSTGSPAVFTANPDTYSSCAAAKCVEYWANAVAAKVYLLARNTVPTAGFTDRKSYTLGMKADGTTPNTVAAANDAYKRHVFQTVVRLNNSAGRNQP